MSMLPYLCWGMTRSASKFISGVRGGGVGGAGCGSRGGYGHGHAALYGRNNGRGISQGPYVPVPSHNNVHQTLLIVLRFDIYTTITVGGRNPTYK